MYSNASAIFYILFKLLIYNDLHKLNWIDFINSQFIIPHKSNKIPLKSNSNASINKCLS